LAEKPPEAMTILFGHPAGNPNAHHSALAHFEAGHLEAFCVPWFPSSTTVRLIEGISPLGPLAKRFGRRYFPKLANAPKIQGRSEEFGRLARRVLHGGDERLSYQANDWLMRTMRKACRRPAVTAVHSFEDCSLWQFAEARRLGKACIYDMPIGYYPAWEQTQNDLTRKYADWVPEGGLPSHRYARPEQKRREMLLADLVMVPSSFVETTVRSFHPDKRLARAMYGVDLDYWTPGPDRTSGPLRFIYAGQLSLRKGIPFLLEAWASAAVPDSLLEVVGSWQLAGSARSKLPPGVRWVPPRSSDALREHYRAADVFIFPSFFEGFGLVLLEAMACGLPAIASEATAGPDVLDGSCGQILPTGNIEALIEGLRWFGKNREKVAGMSAAARSRAEQFTWDNYRRRVTDAVKPFV
jgi:starch synthase